MLQPEAPPAPRPGLGAWGRSLRWAGRLGAILLVLVGGRYALMGLRLEQVGAALTTARPWPLVAGAALNLVHLVFKAGCWRALLAPTHRLSVLRLYRYTVAASALSCLVPARAGEALRVWLLRRRDGVPLARGATVAVTEKVLDALAMLVLMAPLPWLLPDLPRWVLRSILGLSGLGLVALGGLAWVVHWARPGLRQPPGALLRAGGFLVASWLTDLGVVSLSLHAVGLHLPWPAGLLILLTLNLAIAVPSTPAQVGAFELGAMAALRLLDVADAPALAFALFYHLIQVVPLLVLALLDIRFVLAARVDGQAGSQPASV